MKRILSIISILSLFAVSHTVHAQSPVGSIENATCSTISGWSYDPDPVAGPVMGCTNPSATNYNPSATQDDGSCTFPPSQCISRYRWVNVDAGPVGPNDGCAAAGAVAVASASMGICASGEDRPTYGSGYDSINYSRGTWGSGNGGGGTDTPFQNGGYRCYLPGQPWDKDNTDVAVAYLCDFGAQYSTSCPADNPPAGGGGGGGGGWYWSVPNEQLNFDFRGGFDNVVDAFTSLWKPFFAYAASSDSNSVLIYEGGVLLATVPADQYRPDVNAVMGISGNHGFSWAVPESLRDGSSHTISVLGTDTDGNASATALSWSPQVLQCSPGTMLNSSPTSPSLTCPANGSYTNTALQVSFSSTDADANGIRYRIDWDANGTVDEVVPSGGSFAGSGSQQSASRTWTSAGQKTVLVVAEDSQGAFSTVASCTFTLVASPTPSGAQCDDGLDNDSDGLVDLADPGCASSLDTDETDLVITQCSDGLDNDSDGLIDLLDPNCANSSDNNESAIPQCTDGVDNDGDGNIDFPADAGCANANDDTENTDNPGCTINCGGDDGGGGGSGPTGGGPGGSVSGFTVSGDPTIAIQFLANLEGTSETAPISVNPFGGYAAPVTISVESVRSAGGAELPSHVVPRYYFDGSPASSVLMTYNSGFGYYTNPSGSIGTTFMIKLSKKITEKYYVTLVGTSGSMNTTFVIELNPNSINPDFREI